MKHGCMRVNWPERGNTGDLITHLAPGEAVISVCRPAKLSMTVVLQQTLKTAAAFRCA